MITSGIMSSNRQDWATPWDLFNKLNEEFGFDLDVCADDENHKCERYFTVEDNGLEQKWEGVVFCNPPYSSDAKNWIKKAYEYSLGGGTAVCLIASRTDNRWWHEYVMKSTEIRFIRGRVKFIGAESGAPFPSAVVVFSPKHYPQIKEMEL